MKGDEEDGDEPDYETYISQALYELRFVQQEMKIAHILDVFMKKWERGDST